MLSPKEIDEVKEQAYIGAPSVLKNVCLIKPLSLKEIVSMGTLFYNSKVELLLLNEASIAEIIKEKTKEEPKIEEIKPLSYLLQSAEKNNMFLLELQSAFSTFITEEVLLLPKINSVLVGPPDERRMITEENFSDFQSILRIQNCKKVKEPPPENESAIARKFRLKREARDAIKQKQQDKNGESQSLVDMLAIADVFGIHPSERTLYSFYSLIKMHQSREKWDQDIQMLCAGADAKKMKTKYWGSPKEK